MRKILCLSFILVICLYNTAAANILLPSDDYFDKYEISNNIEFNLEKYDVNDFKYLNLKTGFEDFVYPTFSTEKSLMGEGEVGTNVLLLVYYEEDGQIKISYEKNYELGGSGIYNEIIPLDNIGSNYILLVVKKGNETIGKIININRKEKETKKMLETNFIKLAPIVPNIEYIKED